MARHARVNEESHIFNCHPHVYPQLEWTIPAFTPQLFVMLLIVDCIAKACLLMLQCMIWYHIGGFGEFGEFTPLQLRQAAMATAFGTTLWLAVHIWHMTEDGDMAICCKGLWVFSRPALRLLSVDRFGCRSCCRRNCSRSSLFWVFFITLFAFLVRQIKLATRQLLGARYS